MKRAFMYLKTPIICAKRVESVRGATIVAHQHDYKIGTHMLLDAHDAFMAL